MKWNSEIDPFLYLGPTGGTNIDIINIVPLEQGRATIIVWWQQLRSLGVIGGGGGGAA